jgi:hypothetical protein
MQKQRRTVRTVLKSFLVNLLLELLLLDGPLLLFTHAAKTGALNFRVQMR